MDTSTIGGHDDRDAATILPIETGQGGLQERYVRAVGTVRWPKV